jgi:hypothetical protein
MTPGKHRHCEERSDEAIPFILLWLPDCVWYNCDREYRIRTLGPTGRES